MLNATFRPLENWPGKRTESRRSAQFRVTYTRSLDLLEDELKKLHARDVVIQVDGLTLDDIRNDGWPRSTWSPGRNADSGVIISFQSKGTGFSFPCDRFVSWQDNVRAIALSLEALRTVDRYGVTRGNEQYRGWMRLEAPKNGMNRQEAISFLQSITPEVPFPASANPEATQRICRDLRARFHPDRTGSDGIFLKIGEAQAVLCKEEQPG